jgi:hypothetical protein
MKKYSVESVLKALENSPAPVGIVKEDWVLMQRKATEVYNSLVQILDDPENISSHMLGEALSNGVTGFALEYTRDMVKTDRERFMYWFIDGLKVRLDGDKKKK